MSFFRKQSGTELNVAFSITPEVVTVAGIKEDLELAFCDYIELESLDDRTLTTVLTQLIDTYELANADCTLVLDSLDYQLLMTDQLNVPEDEMAKALKWRIKGLLDYPSDDVVIDAFNVRPHGTAKQREKVFVVASSQKYLHHRLALFEKNLLNLTDVDVAVMAERNIISWLPDNEYTTILLSPHSRQCQMTIYHAGEIFLVRRIAIDIDSSPINQQHNINETLQLELQRSIDYCVSELKLAEPSTIYLSPHYLSVDGLMDSLTANLTQTIHAIDLSQYLVTSKPIDDYTLKTCWLSLGAAMSPNDVLLKREAHATS